MTQSLPHIRLGYSGFFICASVSLSATCTESYKQIFCSLTFTASSLPSPPPTAVEASLSTAAAMVMMG